MTERSFDALIAATELIPFIVFFCTPEWRRKIRLKREFRERGKAPNRSQDKIKTDDFLRAAARASAIKQEEAREIPWLAAFCLPATFLIAFRPLLEHDYPGTRWHWLAVWFVLPLVIGALLLDFKASRAENIQASPKEICDLVGCIRNPTDDPFSRCEAKCPLAETHLDEKSEQDSHAAHRHYQRLYRFIDFGIPMIVFLLAVAFAIWGPPEHPNDSQTPQERDRKEPGKLPPPKQTSYPNSLRENLPHLRRKTRQTREAQPSSSQDAAPGTEAHQRSKESLRHQG